MDTFYTKEEFDALMLEATRGEAMAQFIVGYIYETGNIKDITEAEREELINLEEALDWYDMASSDGWSEAEDAKRRVREILLEKSKKSSDEIELSIALAKRGDLENLYIAGCGLLRGQDGWKLQPERGEKFLLEAIDNGSSEACKALAHLYLFCPSPSFVSKEKCLEFCDLAEKMEGKSLVEMELLRELIKNDLI